MVHKLDAHLVKVADTTAAGDTFVGYFIASLSIEKYVKKALEITTKAASIAVSKLGAFFNTISKRTQNINKIERKRWLTCNDATVFLFCYIKLYLDSYAKVR